VALLWWYRFSASVSAREGRRWDEALPEDEVGAASSWFKGKEAWHGAAAWRRRSVEMEHQGGEREETTPVGLPRILLSQKMNKIHAVDSVGLNGQ
jgi:hypothetical protein